MKKLSCGNSPSACRVSLTPTAQALRHDRDMMIQHLNRYPNRSMLVRYWQPFQEIEAMRRQFDRLLGELAPTPAEPTAWAPAVELHDTGDAFTLRAQLPGLEAKDIDIQVSREAIALSGEYRQQSQQEDNGTIRSEFRYGKFHRVVRLPAAVQNDQVQAQYKDGILHLTLPKTVERDRVVKLNLSDTAAAISDSESTESATEANSQG